MDTQSPRSKDQNQQTNVDTGNDVSQDYMRQDITDDLFDGLSPVQQRQWTDKFGQRTGRSDADGRNL